MQYPFSVINSVRMNDIKTYIYFNTYVINLKYIFKNILIKISQFIKV